jgi:hypothetical protein
MGIPRQVEENAAMAEELLASMNGADAEESTEEQEEQASTETEETAQADSETEAVVEAETQEAEVDWEARATENEQKFKTADGMLKAQSKEFKEFKDEVLSRLGDKDTTTETEAPLVVSDEDKALAERIANFKEEYTPEYVADLVAVIRSELAPEFESKTESLQTSVDEVKDTQLATAQENFASYLNDKTDGKWTELCEGTDSKFVDFLKQPDPSGLYTNGQLLKAYNNAWDADKLATLVNLYLGKSPAPVVEEEVSTATDGEEQNLIAPKRSAPVTPAVEGEKIFWTSDSFAEFQKQDRAGKFTEEESQNLWNDAISAPGEGRMSH